MRDTLLRCVAVGSFRVWSATFLALSAIAGSFVLQAQQTDEEKSLPVRKARAVKSTSDDETPTPSPKAKSSAHKKRKNRPANGNAARPSDSTTKGQSASDSPKPKKKKTPSETAEDSPAPGETPEATPKAKKKSAEKEASPKSKKKKKATPGKGQSGSDSPSPKKKKSSARPSETPEAGATPTVARAVAVPNPSAPPPPAPRAKSALAAPIAPVEEPEQLTIEKYGYEKPRGFWARVFGGSGRSSGGGGYRYLTASVKAQIDRAPVARGRWQYIVVHNSGTRQGNAAAFDYYHRHFRRMQNGLAYHFVIGNGTSTGNGQVEVGDRWRRQINGGHVHSDYLNNIALGICLVGDFNRDQPTRAQLECCEELIRYLRQRCGKVGDHWPIVKPHREINPPRWATDCPGDVFPYSWFRRFQ